MIQFGMREVGIGAIIAMSVVAASMEMREIERNADDNFDRVVREIIERKPVAPPPKPKPSAEPRSAMEKMATSVATVAIQVSLIPHDLLDRAGMERQIRGELENQLGDGWTVEVTCYAGWCHIKLIHTVGEIWIDAEEGIATKSVYLN